VASALDGRVCEGIQRSVCVCVCVCVRVCVYYQITSVLDGVSHSSPRILL
jgi:hypothetical protein